MNFISWVNSLSPHLLSHLSASIFVILKNKGELRVGRVHPVFGYYNKILEARCFIRKEVFLTQSSGVSRAW